MSITKSQYSQLVAAPMLQDIFVNASGDLLAGGVIYAYQDADHTTFKNWYYQIGTYGNYSYVALQNPLVLSASGTIQDVNGNDVIPFYYPFDENNSTISQKYFFEVYNSSGTLVFTRANFPSGVSADGGIISTVDTLDNYIINNRFWRNVGSFNSSNLTNSWTTQYNTASPQLTYYYITLAPSQHDGFSMPDFNYIIQNATAPSSSITETITFNTFTSTQAATVTGDICPEYYINHTCTADTTGSTLKIYQFPISFHLATLQSQGFSITIQGQSVSGENIIGIYLYQFSGTGSSTSAQTLLGTIALTNSWTKYILDDLVFPSTTPLALSAASDDAFYLQISMPTGSVDGICNLNFTIPSLYLSSSLAELPSNSFATYDQIDTIISNPRTGDIRAGINQFYPYGWVAMNDGVMGLTNPGSNAQYVRANADVWQLFYLLWNLGKTHDSGSNFNPLFQMYTNTTGTLAATNYGASAYADFTSNVSGVTKALQLPFIMGQVLLGTVPVSALLPAAPAYVGYTSVVTASSSTGLLWTTASSNLLNLFLGNTVTFTGAATLVNVNAKSVYYVIPISSTTFKIATTFANALAGTAVAYTGVETGAVTAYLQQTASNEGEYAHTQLVTELAAHTHTYNVPGSSSLQAGANAQFSNTLAPANTGSTGSSAPFNVTQPGTFVNIYIKL